MSDNTQIQVFGSIQGFEQAQRMANALVASGMAPTVYQNNPGAAIVALDVANRVGMSPLMVMQNLDIIHGRPAWSSKFLAGLVPASKRFGSLRYDMQTDGEAVYNGKKIINKTCRAWAKDLSDGSIVQGPEVSVRMAIEEGWWSRKSKLGNETSKWQTMTELMLCYRAAAFFARLYVSDLSCGLQTIDEVNDIHDELNTIEGVVIESLPKQEPKQEPVAEVQTEQATEKPKAMRKTKPKEEPVVVEIRPEPETEPNDFDGLFGGK